LEVDRFGWERIISVLADVGRLCSVQIPLYVFGGGAMAFRKEKEATKDVDVLVETTGHLEELKKVFAALGFKTGPHLPLECKALTDAAVLVDSAGMRIDIFFETICNKLSFSNGMESRSELYGDLNNLRLYVCSREDIFLLKSVTERSRDLEDMLTLYRKGLRKETLFEECQWQDETDKEGRIWESFLVLKVEEMEEKYSIVVPWKEELRRIAEMKIGAALVMERLKNGVNTIPRLAENLCLTRMEVRSYVRYLEEDGRITANKIKKPFVYTPSY
jgi:hypothetical protein